MNEPRSLTDVTRELDLSLNGPVQMVQEFLPHLKIRPNALIVNVSSGCSLYCIGKDWRARMRNRRSDG
jgi:short-subunit dehydrogenase involved in D-alanine esterification of teichoic acids